MGGTETVVDGSEGMSRYQTAGVRSEGMTRCQTVVVSLEGMPHYQTEDRHPLLLGLRGKLPMMENQAMERPRRCALAGDTNFSVHTTASK